MSERWRWWASDPYVGGAFTQTGDGTLTNLGYIVRGLQQQPSPVQQPGAGVAPEASSFLLLGSGLAGLGAYARLRWRGRKGNQSRP